MGFLRSIYTDFINAVRNISEGWFFGIIAILVVLILLAFKSFLSAYKLGETKKLLKINMLVVMAVLIAIGTCLFNIRY